MPELIHKERLQPSLLDRLTDGNPRARVESADKRVISPAQLRRSVLRDLGWLLNTIHLESMLDLQSTPEAQRSVVNYGMPDLTGQTVSGIDPVAVAEQVRAAIVAYEPRLLGATVAVLPEALGDHNSLRFRIEAMLWSQPLPVRLQLRTEIDLEDGHVLLSETKGADDPH